MLTLKPSFLIIQRLELDDSEDSDSEAVAPQPVVAGDVPAPAPAPAIEASPPRAPVPPADTTPPPDPVAQGASGGKKGKRRAFKSATDDATDTQGSDVVASPDPAIAASETVIETEPIPISLPEESTAPAIDPTDDDNELSTVWPCMHCYYDKLTIIMQSGTVGKKKGKRRAFKSATKDE